MTAYEVQLEHRLTALGFTGDRLGLADGEGPQVLVSRAEPWGRLYVAVAPPELTDDVVRVRLADLLSGALTRAAVMGGSQGDPALRHYALLVFPFQRGVPEEVGAALRALRREATDLRWGLIPWAADLNVELIDRHAGFPPVDLDVVRAVAEGPAAGHARAARPNRYRVVRPGRERWGGTGTSVTRFILAVTVAFYLWVALMGGRGLLASPSVGTLLQWGANHGRNVLVFGEHWRLLTHLLLHGSLIHLGFNMWALWNVGRYVEILFGPVAMAFIYVVGGIAGGVASTALRPAFVTSVGASGAVLGLMGALLYFAIAQRGRVDWRPIAGPVLINLFIGFAWVGIDNYAHVGGVVGGFAAAFLSGLPGERAGWRRWAVVGVSLLLALALSGRFPLPHMPLFR